MNGKVLLLGVATLVFALGYGIFLADLLISGIDSWGSVAGAVMGGGVLLSLAVGTWAMVELQRFLGKEE